MNNAQQIIFEQYPAWYLLFCLLAGGIYATILYFHDTTFKEVTGNQRRLLPFLYVLRFLGVSTIAFLLLAPLLRSLSIDTIKPTILVLTDNSSSVGMATNTADSTALVTGLNTLTEQLAANYNVATYHFGEKLEDSLRFSFDEKQTNISQSIAELHSIYTNQNVGAVVLATDGIYNQGSNPVYSTERPNAPFYCIALGDTTPRKDLVLEKILHNRIAYLGDKFTLRADYSAKTLQGSNTVLEVYKGDGGSKVYSKPLTIKNNNFYGSDDIVLDATTVGVTHYVVKLAAVAGELTTDNNRQDIYIEVLDSRRKVLIFAASPHPDIAALRSAIESNKNYQTEIAYAGKFSGAVTGYNLAILHGIPSKNDNSEAVIKQLHDAKIPQWYIITSQTAPALFNTAQNIVQMNSARGDQSNDVRLVNNGNFNLFNLEDGTANFLAELPPLQSPFGDYSAAPTSQTLFTQKIGSIATKYPLLAFEQATGDKIAVLAGEGLWRWRIYNNKKNNNANAVNDLITKTVQYLSVKNDKRKFRVSMPKTLFNEGEQISFDAEFYNDSYQRITDPEVTLTVYDNTGKKFPYVFSKTADAYTLNIGFLPVGNYTYKANTSFNGQNYSAEGQFSVVAIQLESMQTQANHALLYLLAKETGGAVIYPDSLGSLAQKIGQIPATQYSSTKTQSMINLKWLFFLILGFVSFEWFIRKYLGGY
ncbi:MAG: hypothetical protein IT272_10935 [Chitinophagales bacterium]|jgi:hypothetical protein|nr:hypothetical protein [Sphingobacteriales bacterium]MCC7057921.1 hypothetical protein [Chitinophagales bacterium]MDA0198786.1 hypothetical protein [Bacteroidota bacterium]